MVEQNSWWLYGNHGEYHKVIYNVVQFFFFSYVISGDADGKLYVWDWKTTKLYSKFKAHDDVCATVLWHPHETSKVASCGWDGVIKYWDWIMSIPYWRILRKFCGMEMSVEKEEKFKKKHTYKFIFVGKNQIEAVMMIKTTIVIRSITILLWWNDKTSSSVHVRPTV